MSEGPVITKKQFIAGAVCPACSEPDKLKMWTEDNVPHRECVACGYTDHPEHRAIAGWGELPTHIHHRTDALAPFLAEIGAARAKEDDIAAPAGAHSCL